MPHEIDRIAPTLRPDGRTAMRQRWAELLFLHWPVPVEAVRPLIPDALEIDAHDGVAYVGLVPFTMTGIRYSWAPAVPGTSRFHEVNVRTYVHLEGRDPGVWFFSLDAANALAVRVARRFWSLPYHFARMSLTRGADEIAYRSDRLWPGPTPAGCDLAYRPEGTPGASAPGSLEHFLAERYVLYATHRGRLFSGRVHHEPYPLQPARVLRLEESLVAAAGLPRPADVAPLAHYASEVRVRIYPLRPVV
ncbi:YqjF family protein [Paludisphaera mucosa]|uniref:DUF2071 domain-containing protein n=1 Tax=Paludisphaera mucosa TaxID=3030827 RepID=A0ABT6FC27_9BACT|nr:DUF2071 domain-containing protein [Paludisphaera mucosa]MDG3005131.1 DUF2071 domain-containing protein [Paludisphaera mucosa]